MDYLSSLIEQELSNSEAFGAGKLKIISNTEDDVDMKNKIDIQKLVPFVSEECMDKFVDLYVQGKYKNVNIDELYPFMNNKSIKKIFSYYLCKD